MIKPRAVKDKKVGEIITHIENNGFVIRYLKTRSLTHNEAAKLYMKIFNFFP